LHLWNEKSLEAIGNTLEHFINVDKKVLISSDKKLAKVLVELDIHEGLLESIDIDWRRNLIRKKLDYLGIPFRCTYCRKRGHLRRHCPGFAEEELSEDTMLYLLSRVDSLGVNSQASFP
jgi:hypothetical protein